MDAYGFIKQSRENGVMLGAKPEASQMNRILRCAQNDKPHIRNYPQIFNYLLRDHTVIGGR